MFCLKSYVQVLLIRAVEPDSLNPDPDPAFQVNPDPIWIRIQFGSRYGSGSNPDPGFLWPKSEEKISRKFVKNLFLVQNCNLLTSKLHERRSALASEHLALKKIKFITSSLCFWVIFALLDPDTDQGTPIESGSTELLLMKEINYTILYWVFEKLSHSNFISDPDLQQYLRIRIRTIY